jgi:hypothetical protein
MRVVIAVVGVILGLSIFSACSDVTVPDFLEKNLPDENGVSGFGSHISLDELPKYLEKLPVASADDPNIIRFEGFRFSTKNPPDPDYIPWGDIYDILRVNTTKYIALDLSECTARDNEITGNGVPASNDMNIIRDNDRITKIMLPVNLEKISDHTFSSCSNLRLVEIPLGVTSIGNSAFQQCSQLAQIAIPGTVGTIGNTVFQGCVSLASATLSYGVSMIGTDMFAQCINLHNVSIPTSVNSIGDYAFFECDDLITITIPRGVAAIKQYAFSRCDNLQGIRIPDTVSSIEQGAFEQCTAFTDVAITSNLTSIASNVFTGSSAINRVTLPANMANFSNASFPGGIVLWNYYTVMEGSAAGIYVTHDGGGTWTLL